MPRFTFQRRIRTIASEQYNVFDEDSDLAPQAVGQADLHYITPMHVHVSLVLFESVQQGDLEQLLTALDDDVVASTSLEGRSAQVVVFAASEHAVYELDGLLEDDGEERPTDESQIV